MDLEGVCQAVERWFRLGRRGAGGRDLLSTAKEAHFPDPLCDITSGCCFFTGALDSHPFFPSPVVSGRCIWSAAAASAPAGVVSAFGDPRRWCAGAVLVAAGAICALAVPSSWHTGGCAGCCGGRLTIFAAHAPLPCGRPPPASPRFHVREAQVPHSSAHCTGRPHLAPHPSMGGACAWRAPCWSRVTCAWRVAACTPLWLTRWWPTGCWIPWAQVTNDVALQGPQGWPFGCPIPCAH